MSTEQRELHEMNCKQLVELITEYLEGAMTPAERTQFEEHLGECDGCRLYVDQMQETISALGHVPPESLSPEAEHRLLMAFRDWSYGRP